jgi:hypothetical protein
MDVLAGVAGAACLGSNRTDVDGTRGGRKGEIHYEYHLDPQAGETNRSNKQEQQAEETSKKRATLQMTR